MGVCALLPYAACNAGVTDFPSGQRQVDFSPQQATRRQLRHLADDTSCTSYWLSGPLNTALFTCLSRVIICIEHLLCLTVKSIFRYVHLINPPITGQGDAVPDMLEHSTRGQLNIENEWRIVDQNMCLHSRTGCCHWLRSCCGLFRLELPPFSLSSRVCRSCIIAYSVSVAGSMPCPLSPLTIPSRSRAFRFLSISSAVCLRKKNGGSSRDQCDTSSRPLQP